jgi:UDP-N-acetylmuramoyl-L-alanyl-D-glutamate--2,6-diaminopimelate ligase
MTLMELLSTLDDPGAIGMPDRHPLLSEGRVRGVSHDSRSVTPGSVFVAVRGQVSDGASFAAEAIRRGAIAVISESQAPPSCPVPWIVVKDARLSLALLSDAVYGHPSRSMQVVGITGTNGKTTTAYLLQRLFESAGIRAGLLGTVAYRIGEQEKSSSKTTPEAPEVQGMLREMVDCGCGACVMEVSSHALALRRVDGTRFCAAVFTNLTRDHLDFHGDMEQYFHAKRRLFEMLPAGAPAIVNADDPKGQALLAMRPGMLSYGVEEPADVRCGPVSFSLEGLEFEIQTPSGPVSIRSPLLGRPNLYNILAAAAAAVALDLPLDAIREGIASVELVPGRFQVVSVPGDDITVIVDYAHTDDALRNLLETARPLAGRRLITVFGCGGDRDRSKRPLMGAVAARLSDLVVITSDNPRSEDPFRIIEEIKLGLGSASPKPIAGRPERQPERIPASITIADRRSAISRAIALAKPGDMVVIAGKGHEKYQVIGSRILPFDDVEVAREALVARLDGAGAP